MRHAKAPPAAKKSGAAPAAKRPREPAPEALEPPTENEPRHPARTALQMPSAVARLPATETETATTTAPLPGRPPVYSPAPPAYPPPPHAGAAQLASIAAPRPAPPASAAGAIGTDYRGALSTWLERHKIYPEAARQRGEEGSAVLRFRVGRDGRVLEYRLVRSTGFAELDAAIDRMMRGATLPPFPASMPQPEIAVSVPIRFSLNR
jgi:protein TonB